MIEAATFLSSICEVVGLNIELTVSILNAGVRGILQSHLLNANIKT
jgi:hypothetical protein